MAGRTLCWDQPAGTGLEGFSLPGRVTDPVIVSLAAAAGIDPTVLPPVRGERKARVGAVRVKRPRKSNCADSDLEALGGAALWAALRGPEPRAPRHRSIHENAK
ncbi:MAG: hypothetical protein HYZ53_00655 [Planctomycetes bacterium]|nr:hypothetical protein [Planctomycetota bacterium]